MLLPLQAGCSKLASKARPFLLHYKLLKRAAKKTQALMGAFYVIDQIFGKFFC